MSTGAAPTKGDVRALFERSAAVLLRELDDVVEEFLRHYISALRSGDIDPRAKHFNDPVWKTISLEKWEIAIVDSPIMQRLRRVRQLGVAERVFPGAGYSRFEHAIGALQAMELLTRSIGRSPGMFEAHERWLLRLAALLHDIGHCAFSHVSEDFYRDLTVGDAGTLEGLRVVVDDQLGARPSPSEILSAAIVTTPAFVELLAASNAPVTISSQLAADWIAKLTMGAFPEPTRPMLTQLLTGPFDADKLDYMSRDCATAGIPLPVDIPRLIEKIRPISEKVGNLGTLGSRFQLDPDRSVTILGVALAGSRAIEEMLIARLILFDKLYFHSKVRAAEGVVRRCLAHIVTARPEIKSAAKLLALDDEQVLGLGVRFPIDRLSTDPSLERASRLARQLIERRLPKRAFCFARLFLSVWGDAEQVGWTQLVEDVSQTSARTSLEDEIREVANQIRKQAGQSPVDSDDVYVSKPNAARVHTSAETYLMTDDGRVLRFGKSEKTSQSSLAALFEIDRWADAYETNKGFGYVMCDEAVRPVVHVASEIVLARRYKLFFSPGRYEFCKLKEQDLRPAQWAANNVGLFAELPALVPPSQRLTTVHSGNLAREVVNRLSAFEGDGGLKVSLERVLAWANQFDEAFQVAALETASKLRLFRRPDFVGAIKRANGPEKESTPSAWVPLGGPHDSASLWSYFLHDTALKELKILPQNLEAALRSKLPIVFFDDCINSGGQVATIFSQWLALEGAPTDEVHVTPLPEDLRDVLKAAQLRLIFCVGPERAADQAREKLVALGLKAEVNIIEKLPEDGLEAVGVSPEAREHFGAVGYSLLRSSKTPERWSDERCRECQLGYGGSAQLFTFWMNTPTFAPPMFWSSGKHRGREWLPLLPRRPK